MLQYNVNKYTNGTNGYSLLFCDTCYTAALTANVETTITIPNVTSVGMSAKINNTLLVQFSYHNLTLPDCVVWVNLNATATVPAGNLLAFAGSDTLNPSARMVKGGDVIHIITAQAGVNVCLELWSLQQ